MEVDYSTLLNRHQCHWVSNQILPSPLADGTYVGDNNRITGNNLVVIGHGNYIVGKKVTVIGNYNTLVGSESEVHGSHNKVSGRSNSVSGSNNTLNMDSMTDTPPKFQINMNRQGTHRQTLVQACVDQSADAAFNACVDCRVNKKCMTFSPCQHLLLCHQCCLNQRRTLGGFIICKMCSNVVERCNKV